MPAKKAPGRPSGQSGRVVDLPVKKRASTKRTTGQTYAKDPQQPYIRISQRTAAMLDEGDNFDEWDDEELRRGQRKVNGQFRGPPPAIVPRGAYNELVERTINQCMETMRQAMPAMVDVLITMAKDDGLKASDRIKIIEMMMDRVFGKPKERKDLRVTQGSEPWRTALDVAIVSDEEETGS